MKHTWLVGLLVLGMGCASDDGGSFAGQDVGNDTSVADDAGTKADGPDGSTEPDAATTELDAVLAQLATNFDATVQNVSDAQGWPLPVENGYLFVSRDFDKVAGDFDAFGGTPMEQGQGFHYVVLNVDPDTKYKFTNGTDFVPDPWSRQYMYDDFGEVSLVRATQKHLERFFNVAGEGLQPRRVRVLVPQGTPTHVLYMHDGQNLFDPQAINGGWKLWDTAPTSMLIVGIDNTNARMEEYTHVVDDIGSGELGGAGDAYADFVNTTVRGIVREQYGEPDQVGTMGSSLGGLISLHIADRFDGQYSFVGSMSGTLGWGSIGLNNPTMIERYTGKGVRSAYVYVDSGGSGSGCEDADNDGINDDDETARDNYCENKQFEAALVNEGYVYDTNLVHWWAPNEPHSETAWAARVSRPLGIFAGL